jgi:hypothetical protein
MKRVIREKAYKWQPSKEREKERKKERKKERASKTSGKKKEGATQE